MQNQETVEAFTQWFQKKQPVLAKQPVPGWTVNHISEHCFLVMVPDMPVDEKMSLIQYLSTDIVAELEDAFEEASDV